jgi:hypothetical protein
VRYWDDIKEGEVVELGSRTLDKERMVAFAREFDPQPFHTDEKAAEGSIYGGLIAALAHRQHAHALFYEGFLKDTGEHGSQDGRVALPRAPRDTLSSGSSRRQTTGFAAGSDRAQSTTDGSAEPAR